jgi:hypothetical protein
MLALGTAHNASAAGPSQPAYTPLFKADFENSTVGNSVQEFANSSTPAKTTYDNSITGPFGGQRVVRQENTSNNKSFGGNIHNFSPALGVGDEVWVRWYQYFPSGFVFANSTNGDNNGSGGKVKWMRFQLGTGGGARMTFKPRATPSCTAPCSNGKTDFEPAHVSGEGMGWQLNEGRHNQRDPNFSNPPSIGPGQWHAVQMYLRLSKGDVPNGDGNGLIRVWVDDTLIGEFQRNTLPPVGHANEGLKLRSIWWGNYWNGGLPQDQHWYTDEMIITSDKPDTLDSGGRPFIHPQTRVADFSGTQLSPPTPPSNIN